MIIELFSGLGRFDTEEEVIYIGLQRTTKPTICADVRCLPLRPGLHPNKLIASPPCTYFSFARRGRWIRSNRPFGQYKAYGYFPEGIADSLRLVAAAFDAWGYLEAETFILENPMGELGRLLNQRLLEYKAHDFEHKKTNFWSDSRSLKRARIPRQIRHRLLKMK